MVDQEMLSIEEAARLIGVQSHVLRYWETEFSQLAPGRDDQGRRIYGKQDIAVLLRIRELLYAGKHTIATAREELLKAFG